MGSNKGSPRAAQAARVLIEEFGLEHPDQIDVEVIANALGISVIYKKLVGEQGRLIRHRGNSSAFIVVRSGIRHGQTRFVIAHELGHFRLHPDLDQLKQCTRGDMSDYRTSGIESEANRFAAELLMPRDLFKPDCDLPKPSLDAVDMLAKKYGTSLTAAGIQFVQYTTEPYALVFSRASVVLWAARSAEFEYYIDPQRRLLPNDEGCYAADFHAGRTLPQAPLPVRADCWTDNYKAEGRDLWEHSIGWLDGQATCALTLLRHRET